MSRSRWATTTQVSLSHLIEWDTFCYLPGRLGRVADELDLVMYEARRDIVPAVTWSSGLDALTWRMDEVYYFGQDLPTGELGRSIGHWNPHDQWEVFQVLSGEVLMILAHGPRSPAICVHGVAGSLIALGPGAWHLTYAPAGPATVVNIYCRSGTSPAGTDKYAGEPPLRCGLRRSPDAGIVFFGEKAADGTMEAPTTSGSGLPDLEALMTAATPGPWLTDPANWWSPLPVESR